MSLTVLDHPLAKHYLTVLRDKSTMPEEFRSAARRLCYVLTMEATRDLPIREHTVQTPLENIIVDPDWRRAMIPVYVRRALRRLQD